MIFHSSLISVVNNGFIVLIFEMLIISSIRADKRKFYTIKYMLTKFFWLFDYLFDVSMIQVFHIYFHQSLHVLKNMCSITDQCRQILSISNRISSYYALRLIQTNYAVSRRIVFLSSHTIETKIIG